MEKTLENKEMIFDVKNLTKAYGGKRALDDVSCNVKSGEKIAIIGPSGSGKSTLLRCINLLETPDEGEIYYEGKQVFFARSNALRKEIAGLKSSDADPQKIIAQTSELKRIILEEKTLDKKMRKDINTYRAKVGMVFQHFNLFPHLTVLQNITIAPIKLGLVTKEEAEARAEKLLQRISLTDKIKSYPSSLSGGQKQRVAIIRALALEPEAMLFDEPTSALDPEMVKEVLEFISELKDEIKTMLIVTHEMNFARMVSSRILFMDEGKVIADLPPQTLFTKPDNPRIEDFLKKVL